PPHAGATAEKKDAAQGVLHFVIKVRLLDKGFKSEPIVVIFGLVELAFEEFSDDLGFGDACNLLHAASGVSARRWRRRKGIETTARRTAINVIWTAITSRRVL